MNESASDSATRLSLLSRARAREPAATGGSTARHTLAALPDPDGIPNDEPSDATPLAALFQRGLDQVRSEFEPTSWQAFWRTAVEGLPTDVVARELNLSPATVRQHRSPILRRLRRQLGDLD